MKVGDVVMFTDITCRYAKWFYGQVAIAESVSRAIDGHQHCRVRWIQPVEYYDMYARISDFNVSKFEETYEDR